MDFRKVIKKCLGLKIKIWIHVIRMTQKLMFILITFLIKSIFKVRKINRLI